LNNGEYFLEKKFILPNIFWLVRYAAANAPYATPLFKIEIILHKNIGFLGHEVHYIPAYERVKY